ncbi:hypothetical protein GCM10020367_21290 [Streptomyces sannanensis]|uniref:Uncharacterized protein n=1 Tax=Streptomyces sannanensis TaxID=285536 RepID=A0ABP6S9J2_9ACTN
MTTTTATKPDDDTSPRRIPPVPGAEWCDGCNSWCMPTGICGCNNR